MNRLFVAACCLVAACVPASGGAVAADTVVLEEFRITVGSDTVTAGPTTWTVRNDGDDYHTLVVEDATGDSLAAVGPLAPGQAATLTVDLQPGRYYLTCRLVETEDDGTVEDHLDEGMLASVTVRP